jgi:transmembrane sensor
MENENYLADWLSDKISDYELKQLISAADFLAYQKLKDTLQNYTISEPDLDKSFHAVKEKLASKRNKSSKKVISIWRYTAVAATLILFFGLYNLYFTSNEFKTDFGQTNSIVLNDESRVHLNSNSSINYPNFFQFNRNVQLNGEAFFEVKKGSPFTVETSLGDILVLGTKFNVIAFQDFFEVKCYEGKVKVTQKEKASILIPGETIRFYNGTHEKWAAASSDKPTWISGESSFKNVPIRYVIEQLKNQYNITIDYPKTIENIKFTGTFTHKELTVALKTICLPLNLKCNKDQSGKIIISE